MNSKVDALDCRVEQLKGTCLELLHTLREQQRIMQKQLFIMEKYKSEDLAAKFAYFSESKLLKNNQDKDFMRSVIPRCTSTTKFYLLYKLVKDDPWDISKLQESVYGKGPTLVLAKSGAN